MTSTTIIMFPAVRRCCEGRSACGLKIQQYLIQNLTEKIVMEKKQYERPAMRVVALQQRQHLLQVSGEVSGYQKSGGGFSQSEEDPNW